MHKFINGYPTKDHNKVHLFITNIDLNFVNMNNIKWGWIPKFKRDDITSFKLKLGREFGPP
jgi:hypothetical protein